MDSYLQNRKGFQQRPFSLLAARKVTTYVMNNKGDNGTSRRFWHWAEMDACKNSGFSPETPPPTRYSSTEKSVLPLGAASASFPVSCPWNFISSTPQI